MICIPKLALEIQDLLLPATVLSSRLDDRQNWNIPWDIKNIPSKCILALRLSSSVYEKGFLDCCCLCDVWIQREWIWIGREQIWDRKRKNTFSLWRESLNSLVIYRKVNFCTRKHIEVGLNLSLAAGPKMLCSCFYVFSTGQVIRNTWAVPDHRQTNT